MPYGLFLFGDLCLSIPIVCYLVLPLFSNRIFVKWVFKKENFDLGRGGRNKCRICCVLCCLRGIPWIEGYSLKDVYIAGEGGRDSFGEARIVELSTADFVEIP